MKPNVNIDRYRKMSAFIRSGHGEDYERNLVLNQAIDEFDIYQRYSPNTHPIYVNGSTTPILATFVDVSDLELRTDTKWMLTSLENKVYMGDIFKLKGRTWMVMYDKEKNTANCCKVKVQPCNYRFDIAIYEDSINKLNPTVYGVDSITMTYLTDMKEFKQPFPTETGTSFVSVQYNKYTSQIKQNSRIYLYGECFKVTGIDYTNIDFYQDEGKGFLRWTVRPDDFSDIMDNKKLKICDYYKVFPKEQIETPSKDSKILFSIENKLISKNNKIIIDATTMDSNNSNEFKFIFEGNNYGCELRQISKNSFELTSKNSTGIIKIKAISLQDENLYEILRLTII